MKRGSINFVRLKGVDILRQLQIEEVLLRHTGQNWLLFSSHVPKKTIVVGFSGKVNELIHVDKAKTDSIPVIRRYTGGGTVIVDSSTAFVTFIMSASAADTKPYPREIMAWTANIYDPVFNGIDKNSSSNNSSSNSSSDISSNNSSSDNSNSNQSKKLFSLKENDYVFYDDKKIGGNAQTLTSGRWVHHTSFLWDFDPLNMGYLQMPAKRPEYRRNRPHTDFLVTVKDHAPLTSLDHFSDSIISSLLINQYEISDVSLASIDEMVEKIELETNKTVDELARSKIELI